MANYCFSLYLLRSKIYKTELDAAHALAPKLNALKQGLRCTNTKGYLDKERGLWLSSSRGLPAPAGSRLCKTCCRTTGGRGGCAQQPVNTLLSLPLLALMAAPQDAVRALQWVPRLQRSPSLWCPAQFTFFPIFFYHARSLCPQLSAPLISFFIIIKIMRMPHPNNDLNDP